ncbi:MAG: 4Fe-4S dicluster domain-containing protein [Acidobacteriota bacterium]
MSAETSTRFWRVPLDARDIPRIRGEVHVLEERCKGCGYCVEFCPRRVLALSDRFNAKGYHPPDVVAPESCTACRLCELLCPEFAMGVEEITFTEAARAG